MKSPSKFHHSSSTGAHSISTSASISLSTSSAHCIGGGRAARGTFSCQHQYPQPMTPAARTYSCPNLFANTNEFDLGDGSRRRIQPEQLHLLHSVIINYDKKLNQEVDELFDF
jgi:hypothetical protein